MQILCPHCSEWIDTKNGKCPICGGDLFSDLTPKINKKKAPVEEDKKQSNKKRLSLKNKIIIAVVVILGVLLVRGVLIYIDQKKAEEIEEDTPKLLFKGPEDDNIYRKEDHFDPKKCLYPFDIELIALSETPPDTDPDLLFEMRDEQTHLMKQQDMYNQHITRPECQNVNIYQKIGKQKVKQSYAGGWFSYSSSSSAPSALRGFAGCVGRSIGLNKDMLDLYIQRPDKDNRRQFVIATGATHYFEIDSRYTAIPVPDTQILYGFDDSTFMHSRLKKINDIYYSFEVDQQTYDALFEHNRFKIVMQIKDRKDNRYIIYRIYPLTNTAPHLSSFKDACAAGMAQY